MLKRGGKNTQKNYTKKDLHDPDNHDGVITDLESDILECEPWFSIGEVHQILPIPFPQNG